MAQLAPRAPAKVRKSTRDLLMTLAVAIAAAVGALVIVAVPQPLASAMSAPQAAAATRPGSGR